MCFTESIVMRTSPERAFNYLADPATAHVIDPAVISYEPDTLPMRAGTVNARLLDTTAHATLIADTSSAEFT